ncbi:MAG: twitching motility protein PilT [Phenylobacterium sp.]|uniref:putative toxin-antitoxin system toxin component, PIN family n=1 Tax=Phenylobacterium sp. TaxID=1871053 RepID=UPI00262A477D|nr:putative toxin-antitoxin system toxin component, PIN family [Phenylobacterium sp.]MDB5499096.1 twitching motility protein PilT [Phenylobacterium sp.]
MLRVVLDTSVIVTALRSRDGASFALLGAVRMRRVVPLATPTLFLEYEDVLKRPEQRKASGLSLDDVERFLGAFAVAIEPVEVHIRWRPQLRDPGDEMVFEAAINGGADALVTYNVKDFREAAPRFGLRVLRPAELLLEIMG